MSLCEPLLNMALIVELFPSRTSTTVNSWNRKPDSKRAGLRLPPPDVRVGGVDLWKVETILTWVADIKGLKPDPVVLERVLREQTS